MTLEIELWNFTLLPGFYPTNISSPENQAQPNSCCVEVRSIFPLLW